MSHWQLQDTKHNDWLCVWDHEYDEEDRTTLRLLCNVYAIHQFWWVANRSADAQLEGCANWEPL